MERDADSPTIGGEATGPEPLEVEATGLDPAELEALAHALSHDLRSPLRAISNLSEWLREDQAERLDASGREQLGLLAERVAWLDRRLEALVQYARAGAPGAPGTVALGDLVRDLWRSIDAPDGLELEIAGSLPALRFDPDRLRGLLHELLENAARHAGPEARRVRVSARHEGTDVVVSVADDGVGIAPRHHERIFALFQRLAGAAADGVGAGLALARRVARAHGGDLGVESEPGAGAAFHLRLAKARASEGDPPDRR